MKYAYCTLVTNKKYIQGALNLYYSLQAVHASYDFIILISEKLKAEPALANLNTKIIPSIKFKNGNYKDSVCKLYTYSLTQYDKVMFIDSDALVYKNPDYLFELSTKDFIGTKNYYNNLDRSQDINWFVWATIFIIKPVLSIIPKFFNSQTLSSFTNEEDVLMNILDFNNVYLTEELKVPLIHFCGQPKYWESFKEDFKWQEFISYIIKTVTNYRTQYNEKAPLIDMLRLFYDNYLCYKNGDPDIK